MGVLVIFNLSLTAEQIEVIGLGLDELKFKVAAPVAQQLQAQINAQLAARQKALDDAAAASAAPPAKTKRRAAR